MKIAGRDCGCAKRKQWLRDKGLWPGGKARHEARATRVHASNRREMLEEIAKAEAEIEAMYAQQEKGLTIEMDDDA